MWLHSLKVAQLLRSAACLHTNQSRSYLNHLVNTSAIRDNEYRNEKAIMSQGSRKQVKKKIKIKEKWRQEKSELIKTRKIKLKMEIEREKAEMQ